jgi:prepilin-type N-terminal cleavage/methylation domain-containing protein
MAHRSSRGGFTLVELALVLVIMGILGAIAVPHYAAAITRQRLDAAARRVIADLTYARNHAKFSSTSQEVVFDTVNDSYRLVDLPHPDVPNADFVVCLSEEPYHAVIKSADFDGDTSVIYDAYGASDSGGTVVIRVGDWEIPVTLGADTGTDVLIAAPVKIEPAGETK